ncbi:MAG: hypothetical protein CMF36_17070 [Leeuwenhoekiella sp.]|nr:hypothetical protein [Leeuwenhoekiella sp.]MBA82841.1 hypothetical protein [Leeuwenhoekiella sp.]|tara:strand:+ start:13199 stop:13756 length:558 start_codon:yes stop_codon:yes gene_type:complete
MKTKEVNYVELTALLIAIVLFIVSVILVIITGNQLTLDYYIGFALFSSSLFLYLRHKKSYVIVFTLTLAGGILNLYDPFVVKLTFSLIFLRLNITFIVLSIAFIATNKDLLDSAFPHKSSLEEEINLEKKREQQKIQKFINQYQTKSRKDLEYITQKDSGYVNEAKIAAQQVLNNLDTAEVPTKE